MTDENTNTVRMLLTLYFFHYLTLISNNNCKRHIDITALTSHLH